ncbi:MAG TPA: hypothetical protein VIV11_13320, partial [Kofleriaceae bacterium]
MRACWYIGVLLATACRGTSVTHAPAPREQACGPGIPSAACAMFRAVTRDAPLTSCDATSPSRVGEWRFALIGP